MIVWPCGKIRNVMEITKTIPATKNLIWGGTTLKKWGKPSKEATIAEAWELSFRDDGPTLLMDGRALKDVASKDDLGAKVQHFPYFPVLIKLIDSESNLSIQVHPSDDYALKNENSFGKTEMWHIIDARPGAGLYLGFKRETNEEEVRARIKDNTLTDLLHFIPVKPGENYFIPSGTVHAIGAGVTLAEIQQNSNLTYRLYDYGRLGKDGKPRELHVDKAMKVVSFKPYTPIHFPAPIMGECPYFRSVLGTVEKKTISAPKDSFASITFLSGEGIFNGTKFKQGDTFFIPAGKSGEIEGVGEYVLTIVP